MLIENYRLAGRISKTLLDTKPRKFFLVSLITHLHIEEKAYKHDQRDDILVVSNNSTKKQIISAVLKPNGKNMNNQNQNDNNQNKNGMVINPLQRMIRYILLTIMVTSQVTCLGIIKISATLLCRLSLPQNNLLLWFLDPNGGG